MVGTHSNGPILLTVLLTHATFSLHGNVVQNQTRALLTGDSLKSEVGGRDLYMPTQAAGCKYIFIFSKSQSVQGR